MNKRLVETLKLNQDKIKGGRFIDAYNRTIREDGICGTILTGIDYRHHYFVIVERNINDNSKTNSKMEINL